jgi:hypothetical protein
MLMSNALARSVVTRKDPQVWPDVLRHHPCDGVADVPLELVALHKYPKSGKLPKVLQYM